MVLTVKVVLLRNKEQRENLKTFIDQEHFPAVKNVLSKRKLGKMSLKELRKLIQNEIYEGMMI